MPNQYLKYSLAFKANALNTPAPQRERELVSTYNTSYIKKPDGTIVIDNEPGYRFQEKAFPSVHLGELNTFGVKRVFGYRVIIDGPQLHTIYHSERVLDNVKRGTFVVAKPLQWVKEPEQDTKFTFENGQVVTLLRNRSYNKQTKLPNVDFNPLYGKFNRDDQVDVVLHQANYAFVAADGFANVEVVDDQHAGTQAERLQVIFPTNSELAILGNLPPNVRIAKVDDGTPAASKTLKLIINGKTQYMPFGKDDTIHLTTYRLNAPTPKAHTKNKLPQIVTVAPLPPTAAPRKHYEVKLPHLIRRV